MGHGVAAMAAETAVERCEPGVCAGRRRWLSKERFLLRQRWWRDGKVGHDESNISGGREGVAGSSG